MFPDPLGAAALDSAANASREYNLSRRTVLAAGATAGGGLLLSVGRQRRRLRAQCLRPCWN
jgi:hypothetical protein